MQGVSADIETDRVVISISPMAHFAVGFFALSLLVFLVISPWAALLLLIPLAMSVFIFRSRTVADRDSVTARTLLGSTTMRWEDIEGLRFDKSSWARAHLKSGGGDVPLPAVTFSTLPLLTEASGGRVPNPYG
ncbi:MAG: PH domain-containing protein [Mycobacterium sp.]